ncbi:divergent polysaccharide deacetylase family protein [Rhodophyticola sp. CCM32]|uniref:divergent polysaccharide deacetylase family protein n=1 Tax=Rhodophyticola sp. CCM32 TaxID=2916397 RepID=UPI00143CE177|nr:divergent polysaccharide deacetylase family protein [Rhodophyticola sp. CCM32]
MGRGLIVGMFWGALFSTMLLVVVSLNAPLPQRAEAGVEAVRQVSDETSAVAPAPDAASPVVQQTETPVETPIAPDPVPSPEVETPPETPQGAASVDDSGPEDTGPENTGSENTGPENTGPADNVPLPAGSEFNRPPPEEPAALPASDLAPSATPPASSPAPAPDLLTTSPGTDTSPAPQPAASAALDLPQVVSPTPDSSTPEVTDTNADPLAPPPELQPTPLGLPQIETGPVDPTTEPAPAPVPVSEAAPETDMAMAETPAVTRPALPRIGDSTEESAGETEEIAPAPPETGDAADSRPAVEAYAAPFDAGETRPLMAVILIDDPAFGLDRGLLQSFPFPVSFAIDPTRPEAAANAAAYRAAGFEVLLLADMLPEGAVPADVEVALAGAFEILPETVALLDTEQNRIQGDRPVLDAVVAALQASGHGLVAYPRGLNAAEQSAERLGVPAATLFRQIDSERERATVITRYLDRAAFAAVQDGSVIVIGHTYSDTVTALFSWALGTRSESVAIAPISAVLTR